MDSETLLPPPLWSDEPAGLESRTDAPEAAASESLQTLQPRDVSKGDVTQSPIEEVENGAPTTQGPVEYDEDGRNSIETGATSTGSQGVVRIRNSSEWHGAQGPPGVGLEATCVSQSGGQPLQEASLQSYVEATIASKATKRQESLETRPPASAPRNLPPRRMNLYSFSVQHTHATPPDHQSCRPAGDSSTAQSQGTNSRGSTTSPVPRKPCGIAARRSSSVPLPEPATESPRPFAGRIPAQATSRVAVSDPAFTQPHEPDRGDQLWSSLPKGFRVQPPPGPRPATVRPRTAAAATSHEAANTRQPYAVSSRPQSCGGNRTVVFNIPEKKQIPFEDLLDRSAMYRSRISQSWSGDTGTRDARHKPPYRASAVVSDGPGRRARSITPDKYLNQPPKTIRACSASPPRAPRVAPQEEPDEHARRIEIARNTGKIRMSLEPAIEEARKKAAERRQKEKQQKRAELRRAVKEDKEMLEKSMIEASRVRAEMKHDSSIWELRAVTRKNNKEFQAAEQQRLKQRLKVHTQRVQQAGPAVWGTSYLTAEEKEAMRKERLEKLDKERDDKRGKEDARVRAANYDLKSRLTRVIGSLAGTTIQHTERQLQVETWTRQVKTVKMEKQLTKIQEATIRELYRRYMRGKITATEEQAKRWAEVAYTSRHRLNHTPATQQ